MSSKLKKLDVKSKVLVKNTLMLYILQFSSYLFSFITIPYQTRVLGPNIYGVLGVAAAVMLYFQLFMDFGFLLSATEDIAKNRDDRDYICRKITSIAIIKTAFGIFSLLIMSVLIFTVPKFSEHKAVYIIYLLAYAVNSFLPDYVYRGIEKMTAVTMRTIAIKFFFCVMIFVFLRSENDYLAVPVLSLIGNTFAVIFAYVHLFKSLKYSFKKVSFKEIFGDFKRSSVFFYSRIASTVYSATNTVILGFVDTTGIITGYFTSADKVIVTAKNGLSPISDSLYPYMVKNKDFRPAKKVLTFCMIPIILGCIIVGIFAKPLCIFAFGKDFAGTANILRAFLPIIAAILPSYILGFPTMGALGISKYANFSIFIGTGVHIVGIIILGIFGQINGVSLALMTSVSEWSILIYRAIIVYKHRHLMNKE